MVDSRRGDANGCLSLVADQPGRPHPDRGRELAGPRDDPGDDGAEVGVLVQLPGVPALFEGPPQGRGGLLLVAGGGQVIDKLAVA